MINEKKYWMSRVRVGIIEISGESKRKWMEMTREREYEVADRTVARVEVKFIYTGTGKGIGRTRRRKGS